MAKPDEPPEETVAMGEPPRLPRSAIPAEPLARGATVGRYVIVEPLGEGGMGVVYVADDPDLGRRVALKLLRSDLAVGEGDSQGRERLVREARALAKLNHPNVVTIYESGVFGDEVFLAVELVVGTTVKAWLRERPRGWREVLDVFLEAGRGLAAAHAAGIVHRDFKPENVLIGNSGVVKVIDFGLARASGAPAAPGSLVDASGQVSAASDAVLETPLTQAGVISGTPAYMAPEQYLGIGGDARTDEFSFAVALYRSLYGELPFNREGDPSTRTQVKPPPKGTKVPRWVRVPLLRALSIAPEDRYPTLDELLRVLSVDPGARRRRAGAVAGIAVLVIAAAVISGGAVLRRQAATDPCHAPESQLVGVWDDAVRQRLRAALAATGSPDAVETAGYVEKLIDNASRGWLDSYRDACAATRVAHTQTEAALRVRLDCLAQNRLDIRALVEIVLQPDGEDLRAMSGAAGRLPIPSECVDAEALPVVAQAALENGPELAVLRQRLARGRALTAANRIPEAVAVLRTLPDEAHSEGAKRLEVRALVALTLAYAGADKPESYALALELAEKAEPLAAASRLDGLAAGAAATAAQLLSVLGRPRSEVDSWLDRARSNVLRAGASTTSRYDVEHAVANVELLRGHTIEATKHGRRAFELAEQIWGMDHETTMAAANNLAATLDSIGQYDEELALYQRAIAHLNTMFGPRSLAPDTAQMNLSETLFDLGRFEEAQHAVDDQLARPGADGRSEGALALTIRGALQAIAGDRVESLRSVDRALALGDRLRILAAPGWVDLHRYAIETRIRDGQAKMAVDEYDKYLTRLDLDASSPIWVSYLRVGGWAYLAAGQPNKALPILERALTLSAAHPFFPGWVAQLRFQIAEALVATHGDRNRAEALALAAHDDLVSLPVRKALLSEVDAWKKTTLGK